MCRGFRQCISFLQESLARVGARITAYFVFSFTSFTTSFFYGVSRAVVKDVFYTILHP